MISSSGSPSTVIVCHPICIVRIDQVEVWAIDHELEGVVTIHEALEVVSTSSHIEPVSCSDKVHVPISIVQVLICVHESSATGVVDAQDKVTGILKL